MNAFLFHCLGVCVRPICSGKACVMNVWGVGISCSVGFYLMTCLLNFALFNRYARLLNPPPQMSFTKPSLIFRKKKRNLNNVVVTWWTLLQKCFSVFNSGFRLDLMSDLLDAPEALFTVLLSEQLKALRINGLVYLWGGCVNQSSSSTYHTARKAASVQTQEFISACSHQFVICEGLFL